MRRALGCALALAACSPPVHQPEPPLAVHITASEHVPGGARLVVIGESGERLAELVPAAALAARDNSPVFSPDGDWVAFVSSRGRDLGHTNLWVAAARPGATPRRLLGGATDELTPAWTPDGKALVFASNRAGSLDLWRLDLVREAGRLRPAGAPVRLTTAPTEELSPSVGPDGRIAYAALDPHGGAVIEVLDRGASKAVTRGPLDLSPAWSPDGKTIAFSAPIGRPDGTVDADLLAVDAGGGHRRVLVDGPGTDESGPVWSRDGRWLFATSVVQSVKDHKPLFSSIVYADLWGSPPVLRMLDDRSAAVARSGPALAPAALDVQTLLAGAPYLETIHRILLHQYLIGRDAKAGARP